MGGKPIPWSEEHHQMLIQYYPYMSTRELAQMLGRTQYAVQKYAQKHGVKKAPERRYAGLAAMHTPEAKAKSLQTRRELIKSERRRWRNDLPQRTKYHFSGQSMQKRMFRSHLHRKGYIELEDVKNVVFYDENTNRCAQSERTALTKYNIKTLPYEHDA